MTINAQRAEARLADLGWTRKQLASACGISVQNISTVLRRGTCTPITAGKLARGLGVSVAEITASADRR